MTSLIRLRNALVRVMADIFMGRHKKEQPIEVMDFWEENDSLNNDSVNDVEKDSNEYEDYGDFMAAKKAMNKK